MVYAMVGGELHCSYDCLCKIEPFTLSLALAQYCCLYIGLYSAWCLTRLRTSLVKDYNLYNSGALIFLLIK
jgi:hypothetical protein